MRAVFKLLMSFKFAFEGLWFCIRFCRNFRIHTVAATFVIYFSTFYSFSPAEKSIIYVVIGAVLSLECLNTALEQLCDSITTEQSPYIKNAKDLSASAVLLSAICSVFVFVELFYRQSVISSILSYFSDWYRLILLLLSTLVAIFFVFYEDIFKYGKK